MMFTLCNAILKKIDFQIPVMCVIYMQIKMNVIYIIVCHRYNQNCYFLFTIFIVGRNDMFS